MEIKSWNTRNGKKKTIKFLGVIIDECLYWKCHIGFVIQNHKIISSAEGIRYILHQKEFKIVYGIEVWGNTNKLQRKTLEKTTETRSSLHKSFSFLGTYHATILKIAHTARRNS